MSAGAVVCTHCGYDTRTGRVVKVAAAPAQHKGKTRVTIPNPLQSGLLRGCLATTICVAAAGALWAFIAVKTEYEIGFIAWGMGGLAGLAMYATRQQAGFLSGVLAGGITLAGVLVVRRVIFHYLFPGADVAVFDLLVPSMHGLFFVVAAVGTALWVGSRGPSE